MRDDEPNNHKSVNEKQNGFTQQLK